MRSLLRSQLSAGGHDVQAFTVADDGSEVFVGEGLLKGFDALLVGALEFAPGVGVEGDDVDFGFEAGQDFGELAGVFRAVVDVFKEDVFEGDFSSPGQWVVPAGMQQVGDGVFAVDGHQRRPVFVAGGVEGDGQVDFGVAAQVDDAWYDACGGNGNASMGDFHAPVAVGQDL